jgi:hypothetical protein
MATTTNYSWSTPDDTALVKDGASAIRTLGSSADTTVKALNPGTTAGDVDYYTSSTAKARIGIGTNGQVLTSNGSVPGWATPASGGMTLLSTTSLTGATTTISSINQTYNSLFMIISGVTNATADGNFRCAPNASTNITSNFSTSTQTTVTTNADSYMFFNTNIALTRTNTTNSWAVQIFNYSSTTAHKPFSINGGYFQVADGRAFFASGQIATNSGITSLVFSNSSGNLSTGTVLLYGVK